MLLAYQTYVTPCNAWLELPNAYIQLGYTELTFMYKNGLSSLVTFSRFI